MRSRERDRNKPLGTPCVHVCVYLFTHLRKRSCPRLARSIRPARLRIPATPLAVSSFESAKLLRSGHQLFAMTHARIDACAQISHLSTRPRARAFEIRYIWNEMPLPSRSDEWRLQAVRHLRVLRAREFGRSREARVTDSPFNYAIKIISGVTRAKFLLRRKETAKPRLGRDTREGGDPAPFLSSIG